MDVTIIHTKLRPDRPGMLRRARAEVDGHLVTFRSERHRGWRCNSCELWAHAACEHTRAVRRRLREISRAARPPEVQS